MGAIIRVLCRPPLVSLHVGSALDKLDAGRAALHAPGGVAVGRRRRTASTSGMGTTGCCGRSESLLKPAAPGPGWGRARLWAHRIRSVPGRACTPGQE
jgi:hypothetical protein